MPVPEEAAIVSEDPGRTARAIIMMLDSVIQDLQRMGWHRQKDRIEIVQDDAVLPMWVSLRGKRVFEVNFVRGKDEGLSVQGNWLLEKLPRPGVFRRIWRVIRA